MKPKNCLDCGEPIPAKRLIAIPNALYCVGCQSAYDRYATPPDDVMAEQSDTNLFAELVRGN